MGGWLALLTALALPGRVAGLLGLAAAPDFTEDLMWEAMPPFERQRLMAEGVIRVRSDYGELVLTRALIEEGREHLLLRGPIALSCPVRLIHGQQDASVPWETALKLAGRLESADVQVILVKDGDHRLSRRPDLDLMCRTLGGLLEVIGDA
jgi:pimeloyl-ACP methyl ester carboxylesterase